MRLALLTLAAAGLAAGTASGQLISFTYSDLDGSFDSGSGTYMAEVSSNTSGDVSRLDSNPGTAEFDTGTFPHASADFIISMAVTNITASTADGNGTLTILDADGDSLTADVDGVFRLVFGSIFFEGQLSNAFFGNESGDNTFDGATMGSFDNPIPAGPYNGSVVELFFDPGSFFAADFSNQETLVNGLLIPTPGAAAVLGLGGLMAARRRR